MHQGVKKFSDLGIKIGYKKFVGQKVRLQKVLNTEIMVHDYYIKPSKYPERGSDKCLCIQFSIDGKKHIAFSVAKILMETLEKMTDSSFPFTTKISNENDFYEFT